MSKIEPIAMNVNRSAAEYLSVGRTSLYQLKSQNKIKYFKIGGCLRFRKVDLEEFVEQQVAKAKQGNKTTRMALTVKHT
jgi:excisionase family DNA binding protein